MAKGDMSTVDEKTMSTSSTALLEPPPPLLLPHSSLHSLVPSRPLISGAGTTNELRPTGLPKGGSAVADPKETTLNRSFVLGADLFSGPVDDDNDDVFGQSFVVLSFDLEHSLGK
jgi:hypothetical protein